MASTLQDLSKLRGKKTTITYQETNNNSPCGLGPGDPPPWSTAKVLTGHGQSTAVF